MKKDLNTEEKILAAARAVFMEKGMDGARMQDIADRAGINKALLHYYFRNKDKLFEMIFQDAMGRFMPRLADVIIADVDFFVKIEKMVSMYMDMLAQNPYLPQFVLNEVNRQPEAFLEGLWGDRRPPIDVFIALLEREMKKGTIKKMNPRQLVLNIVSMCIFPFAAKPMVQWILNLDEAEFNKLMQQRKKEVATFIIDSIRK
jgi:TetR/AcrR family transcriptional regulator